MSSPFRFKQFQVLDDKSTMKVGTDAVLLGAWAAPPLSGNILDVGTGCGVLALMMAQKSAANIKAIDIHEPSIEQAAENFSLSPWPDRLEAIHANIRDFAVSHAGSFDYIVSNPPFFLNSLKPKKPKLLIAKHADSAFTDMFFESAVSLLASGGKIALVLPIQTFYNINQKMNKAGLFPVRTAKVFSKQGQPYARLMVEATLNNAGSVADEIIVIMDSMQHYTPDYKKLTQDFYLFLSE
ncbi:MAG TPA: methyltransferase domain-containing protein [Bacteroidales bacterium]|nr:methyltransferase domain-containing protein [Bacteroidales bacterium]